MVLNALCHLKQLINMKNVETWELEQVLNQLAKDSSYNVAVYEAVELILKGAEIETKSQDGRTTAQYLAMMGEIAGLQKLEGKKPNLENTDRFGIKMMHQAAAALCAAEAENWEKEETMGKGWARITLLRPYSNFMKYLDVIEWMVEHGAKPDIPEPQLGRLRLIAQRVGSMDGDVPKKVKASLERLAGQGEMGAVAAARGLVPEQKTRWGHFGMPSGSIRLVESGMKDKGTKNKMKN